MLKEFVAYYRVSTTKQGISGLGMEAQRNSVAQFLKGNEGILLAEFAEVESGKNNSRQELAKALAECRRLKATLVIAKLDRLARNAAFLLNLRDSGVEFVAVDMPQADRFTVGIMALVAEREREMTSQRTRDGLAAAKRRGTRLGNPNPDNALKAAREAYSEQARQFRTSLLPVVQRIQRSGVSSLRGIAECLNARGVKTPTGKEFAPQSVKKSFDAVRLSRQVRSSSSRNQNLIRNRASVNGSNLSISAPAMFSVLYRPHGLCLVSAVLAACLRCPLLCYSPECL